LRLGLNKPATSRSLSHLSSLGRYHFLTEGFSNDFAQWARRRSTATSWPNGWPGWTYDYPSLAELRGDLRAWSRPCESNPNAARQSAFEPFTFWKVVVVTVPMGLEARTLQGFAPRLRAGHDTFYHHFIASVCASISARTIFRTGLLISTPRTWPAS
jgi:hypothetical protein